MVLPPLSYTFIPCFLHALLQLLLRPLVYGTTMHVLYFDLSPLDCTTAFPSPALVLAVKKR